MDLYIVSKCYRTGFDNIESKPVFTTTDKAKADAYMEKYAEPKFVNYEEFDFKDYWYLIVESVPFEDATNPWEAEEKEHEKKHQEEIEYCKEQIRAAMQFKESQLYKLLTEWNGNPEKIQPVYDYIDQHPDCEVFYETDKDKHKGESFTYMGTCFKIKNSVLKFNSWFLFYKDKFDFDNDFNNFIDQVPQEVKEWYEKLNLCEEKGE